MRTFTLKTVAQHATPDDAWIIFEGNVYDITKFHDIHPGGNSIMFPYFGKCINTVFYEIGHSDIAKKLLADYHIGTCIDCADCEKFIEKNKNNLKTCEPFVNSIRNGSPNEMISWNEPLLSQIWKFSLKEYRYFISVPNTTTDVVKIMPYSWMEPLSKTPWYLIPLIYIPIVLVLLYRCYFILMLPSVMFLSWYCFGAFLWSLSEYVFHRFIFHVLGNCMPNSPTIFTLHFLLHEVHHKLPHDPLRLVMPPALFIFLTSPIYFLSSLILSQAAVSALWAGALTGYVIYDMMHFNAHHKLLFDCFNHVQEMRRYHMKHHYKNPDMGFGVSTKVWDTIFNTLLE